MSKPVQPPRPTPRERPCDTYPTNEEQTELNASPPDPALTRANDPDVLAMVRQLAGFGGGQSHPSARASRDLVETNRRLDESRAKNPPVGARNGSFRVRTKPDGPCPIHARPPKLQSRWAFPGLQFFVDRAIARSGINESARCFMIGRENRTAGLLNEQRRGNRLSEAAEQLSAATTATDPAVVQRNLQHARMIRDIMAIMVDGLDEAITATAEALGLDQS
jgi:hypothetical protein